MKQKVTLSIDSDIYAQFKEFCAQRAINMSRKIELFMQGESKGDDSHGK